MHDHQNLTQLASIFRAMDSDKDGKLSLEDLTSYYSRDMPLKQATDLSISVIEEADSDKSGFIDYSEFLMAVIQRETLLSHDYLSHTFKLFD